MTTPEQLSKEAEKAFKENWDIGTGSRFCDEPPDFDYASEDEISEALLPFFRRAKDRD